jgi:hypothetical protein
MPGHVAVTSFHHQSEAQHPKSSAIHNYAGRLPILRRCFLNALKTDIEDNAVRVSDAFFDDSNKGRTKDESAEKLMDRIRDPGLDPHELKYRGLLTLIPASEAYLK